MCLEGGGNATAVTWRRRTGRSFMERVFLWWAQLSQHFRREWLEGMVEIWEPGAPASTTLSILSLVYVSDSSDIHIPSCVAVGAFETAGFQVAGLAIICGLPKNGPSGSIGRYSWFRYRKPGLQNTNYRTAATAAEPLVVLCNHHGFLIARVAVVTRGFGREDLNFLFREWRSLISVKNWGLEREVLVRWFLTNPQHSTGSRQSGIIRPTLPNQSLQ